MDVLGHPFWQLLLRVIILLILVQIVTLAVITLAYRRRRRRWRPPRYKTIELPQLDLEDGAMQLYMEGISLFDDMRAAIESAEQSIRFETFIWKNDVLGKQFRDLFIQKARDGVDVYLVYDFFGNLFLGYSRIKLPKDIPNLHVQRYISFRWPQHLLMPSRYNVTHRKLLIVDDNVGFIGGYNLGEEYRTQWRDTHMRLEGEAVRRLAYAFTDFWNHYNRGNLPELEYPDQTWSNIIDVYRNDPLRRNYPIRSIYLRAVERAQNYVLITNAYFVPDPAFRQALVDAAKRGVNVQVILPWQSNHVLVDWVTRHYFHHYLEVGIELYGYEAAMLHTKSVTIDGTWSLIGTANLDRLSLALNHEINVEIFDERVAEQMEAIFACDKSQTRRIEIDRWTKRPLQMKFGELILSPFWPFV